MNTKLKTFLYFVLVVILGVIFATGFRSLYAQFDPLGLSVGFFQVIYPGIIEGFLLAYLFFLPIIFIPAFYKNNLYVRLIPLSILGLVLMVIPWKVLLLSLVVYGVGVLVGILTVWLHKKVHF